MDLCFGRVGVPTVTLRQFYLSHLLEETLKLSDLLLIYADIGAYCFGLNFVHYGFRVLHCFFFLLEKLCGLAFHECSHFITYYNCLYFIILFYLLLSDL